MATLLSKNIRHYVGNSKLLSMEFLCFSIRLFNKKKKLAAISVQLLQDFKPVSSFEKYLRGIFRC